MSSANRVQLSFAQETNWNVMPTAAFQILRYTGESLNSNLQTIASNEIRDDRSISDLIQVSRTSGGGFDFELSAGSYDSLLEGALFGNWTSNVLKNGTARKSYSFEKSLLDVNQFFLYKGLMVDSFSLNLASGSICTGSFSFLGGECTLRQTAHSATTRVAATTTEVMNCMANVASLQEGRPLSAMTGIYVQALSFTLSNNLRTIDAISYNTPQGITEGSCTITGSITCYFSSARLYDKFLSNAASGISFQISKSSKSYTFLFPNVKFAASDISAGGRDQDVMETLSWQALYDSTEGCMIKITRVP